MYDYQVRSYCQEEDDYPMGLTDISKHIQKTGGSTYTVFLVGLSSDFNSAMLLEHFVSDLGY